MKELIAFDERAYQREKDFIERFIPMANDVIATYNLLNQGSIKSDELYNLFINTEEFVFDKMTESNPVLIGGLKLHKHEAIKILKKPKGFENLLAQIENTNSTLADKCSHTSFTYNPRTLINSFELDQNGAVIIKSSKDLELQEKNKKYATSEKAIKLLALANFVIDKSKELDFEKLIKWDPNGIGHLLNGALSSKYCEVGLKINVEGILRHN